MEMVISFDEVLRRANLSAFAATLEDWEVEAFEERAAILEFEAGLPRAAAEEAAMEMMRHAQVRGEPRP